MTNTDEIRRAEFEAWAKTEYLDLDTDDGYYTERVTGTSWQAWQAAKRIDNVEVHKLPQTQPDFPEPEFMQKCAEYARLQSKVSSAERSSFKIQAQPDLLALKGYEKEIIKLLKEASDDAGYSERDVGIFPDAGLANAFGALADYVQALNGSKEVG